MHPCLLSDLITKKDFPKPIENAWDQSIDCGHCVAAHPTVAMHQRSMRPEDCEPIDIQFIPKWERVRQFLVSMRSMRAYIHKPVEKEKILQLLDVARNAPNRVYHQLIHWFVIYDPVKVRRIPGMTIEWMKKQKILFLHFILMHSKCKHQRNLLKKTGKILLLNSY